MGRGEGERVLPVSSSVDTSLYTPLSSSYCLSPLPLLPPSSPALQSHTYTEAIYLLANPLVVWPVFAGVVLSVLTLLVFIRYKGDPALMLQRFSSKMGSVVYCLTVYVLNLLPYVGVARSCFNYHYMPALVYGEMLTALLLVDLLGGRKYGGAVARVLIGLAFVGWLYYSPWIYAFREWGARERGGREEERREGKEKLP